MNTLVDMNDRYSEYFRDKWRMDQTISLLQRVPSLPWLFDDLMRAYRGNEYFAIYLRRPGTRLRKRHGEMKTWATIEGSTGWRKEKYVGEHPHILALPLTFKKCAVHLMMKDEVYTGWLIKADPNAAAVSRDNRITRFISAVSWCMNGVKCRPCEGFTSVWGAIGYLHWCNQQGAARRLCHQQNDRWAGRYFAEWFN